MLVVFVMRVIFFSYLGNVILLGDLSPRVLLLLLLLPCRSFLSFILSLSLFSIFLISNIQILVVNLLYFTCAEHHLFLACFIFLPVFIEPYISAFQVLIFLSISAAFFPEFSFNNIGLCPLVYFPIPLASSTSSPFISIPMSSTIIVLFYTLILPHFFPRVVSHVWPLNLGLKFDVNFNLHQISHALFHSVVYL